MTVDELAQEIRRVDGDNILGAGALAEALMPFFSRTPAPEWEVVCSGCEGHPVFPNVPCAVCGASPVVPVGREEIAVAAVLREVLDWIDNWLPAFIQDNEWAATRAKADAILAALGTKATDTGEAA